MVLGITRERTSLARNAARTGPVYGWQDWLIERGDVRWEATADLTGGFPGYSAHGGRLDGAQIRITDRFFLIDEGRRRGFGLPLAWLAGADTIPSPFRTDRGEPVLRLRYNDCSRVRTFLMRFRGPFLAMRGGRRAEHALDALREVGIEDAGGELPALPGLSHSWLESAQFEQENVIWSGVASAALGPGQERLPCDVWLTTRSVIWGGGWGEGISRLALDQLLDVVTSDLDDRTRTPAVYLACADSAGGRHDIPFVFDRQHPAQRNLRERGAFLVGLRSRGILLGASLPSPQPWQDALARVAADDVFAEAETAEAPLPFRDEAFVAEPQTTRPRFRAASLPNGPRLVEVQSPPRDEIELLPMPAVPLDPKQAGKPAGVFGRGALKLLPWPLEDFTTKHSGAETTEAEVMLGEAEVDDSTPVDEASATIYGPWIEELLPLTAAVTADLIPEPGLISEIDAYEDAVIAVLVEAARGLDDRLAGRAVAPPVAPVPGPAEQIRAHSLLDDLLAEGSVAPEQIRSRRCRLVAAAEAGPRLRTLVELRDAGLLSDADLERKRASIMGPLAEVLNSSR